MAFLCTSNDSGVIIIIIIIIIIINIIIIIIIIISYNFMLIYNTIAEPIPWA